MAEAPLVYQLHAAAAWFLYALWPFSRLVHAWSVPVGYLTRSPILYRSRRAAAERPARTRAAA
jgi:nitrate reductase gamma subunit